MAGICRLRTVAFSASRQLGHPPIRRSYGAAALQADYNFYYEEDEYEPERMVRSAVRTETCASVPRRGVQWVLIGSPGVQKHVYAARLSKLLEVPHISMGSLVRQELNPRSSLYKQILTVQSFENKEILCDWRNFQVRTAPAPKQIANAVNEGKLVPEDIIFGLLSNRLEEGYYRGETGFILDGIPRTRIQAEILDQIADIDLVVNFKCSEDCLVRKQLGSGVCAQCGKSFSMCNSDSIALQSSSTELSQHAQLNSIPAITEDAHKEKLRIYAEQIKPLEDYYRKQKKLLDFQVAGGPGETWQGLLAALHLEHMAAVSSSSHKLTA